MSSMYPSRPSIRGEKEVDPVPFRLVHSGKCPCADKLCQAYQKDYFLVVREYRTWPFVIETAVLLGNN